MIDVVVLRERLIKIESTGASYMNKYPRLDLTYYYYIIIIIIIVHLLRLLNY